MPCFWAWATLINALLFFQAAVALRSQRYEQADRSALMNHIYKEG